MHKMYDDLATWWPLLSPVEEYADEAAFYLQVLTDTNLSDAPSLLELGSGGGSNARYMKKAFANVTLVDLSPQMLDVSRAINPECAHIQGDMRTLRLDLLFDAVFIHDAIDYMTTLDDLRQAIKTAFVHCKSGGVALIAPDHLRETFEPSTDCGGSDGDGRSLRYLEWAYDPDESDTLCTVEYVYALREGNQPARIEHEQHICGLFPRDEWLCLLTEEGFEVEIVIDDHERELFVAHKPDD